jgi:hypothetical protein
MEEPRKSAREKLLEKRKAIDERLRAVAAREKEEERRLDTRRKILAGAVVLEEAGKRPEFKQELTRMLDQLLYRVEDRKLFDLSPVAPPGTVVEGSQSIELLEKVGEAVEAGIRIA